MTLEEAIKHAEEVAEENEKAAVTFSTPQYAHYAKAEECEKCAEEHWQLAEWLTDYQRLLKAIDDIKAEIRHFMFEVNPSSSESDYACNYILDLIDKHIGKESEWIQEQK